MPFVSGRSGLARSDNVVMDVQAMHEADRLALRVLAGAALPLASSLLRVCAVDAWTSDTFGAVLLLSDSGYRGTWVVCARRSDRGQWQPTGGGGQEIWATAAVEPPAPAHQGLRRIGAGGSGIFRHTVGVASLEVEAIRLRSEYAVADIPMGCTRYFLLGITHDDPITYATSIDVAGEELPGSPLLL